MENHTVEFEEKKKVDDVVVEEPQKTEVNPEIEVEAEVEAVVETETEEYTADTVEEVNEEVAEETEAEVEEVAEADTDEFACGNKKKKYEEDEEKEDKFSLECFAVFFEEVPQTVVEVCDALVDKFNKLNEELAMLKEFKAEIEAQNLQVNVDEICAEFDFTEEEISEVKEKAYKGEITLEAFKKELYVLEGMKAHAQKEKFSQKEKVVKPKIAIGESTDNANSKEPYGGLFVKYGK